MGKILLVDDERGIRITMQTFLTDDGHQVDTAEDAEQARELLSRNQYDVVVSDIILPRVSGIELLSLIKQTAPLAQVIMMTGEPTIETASQSLRAGAFDYLAKPISKDAIIKAVRNALFLKFLNDEKLRLEAENLNYQKHLEKLVDERTRMLRTSEAEFRALTENSPDIIMRLDQQGIVHYINAAISRMLPELAPPDLVDRYIQECPVPKEFIQLLKRSAGLVFTHGRPHEEVLQNQDIIFNWRFIPEFDDQEAVQSVLATGRDITAQVNATKEKNELEAMLRRTQKMEAIGTLAGGIAHDFNNILSAVIGFTELSLDDAQPKSLQHANLQEILTAGKRAKELVRQILTFSRQTEEEFKPVQVQRIIKEAAKLLRASLPSTIEMFQELRSEAQIMGDPTQIHQVLMNLGTNAAQAMEAHGGRLEITLTEVILDPEFSLRHPKLDPGYYVQLCVTDTGQGMSAYVRDRIFDPFFTTKKIGEGTGMGLSVVHGIVTTHRGGIYVYSEPRRGSTFKVFFPIVDIEAESEAALDDSLPHGTESILFVDDEQSLVKMNKQSLESLGYQVTTRSSSVEALELFSNNPERFDLVITDMTMPNMTGDVLAGEIHNIRPDLPIILCTGFSSKIDERAAAGMGFKAFITKPILKRVIAQTIRRVLDKNRK